MKSSVVAGVSLALMTILSGYSAKAEPATSSVSPAAPAAATPSELERAIDTYLMGHPEVIEKALAVKAEREQQAKDAARAKQIAATKVALLDPTGAEVLGNPNGDVTLIEFLDYNCSYCKLVVKTVEDLITGDPNLRVILRQSPVLGESSQTASRASMAAYGQGDVPAFVRFHAAVMAASGQVSEATIMAAAKGAGLDVERMKADMGSPGIAGRVHDEAVLATHSGARGTPNWIVFGPKGARFFSGSKSVDEIAQIVGSTRAGGN